MKKYIFIIYSLRTVKTDPATNIQIDAEVVLFLPQKSKELITSISPGDDINELCSKKQHLWIEILNKSFEETVEIKRKKPLGFLVIKPEHLKFRCETMNKKKENNTKETEFIENIQTENERGNIAVFSTNTTLPKQVETWLIKPPRLPLE